MKKILISIIIFLSIVLIGNVSNAASDFTLNSIDFDVQLNEDGSMNVTETWKIDVHSLTNTLFKTFELDKSKYSGITDVKVYEVNKDGTQTEFKEKNVEVLHVDKNCYYGLINSNVKYEIAWGINEKNGEKTYKICYKVEECIKKYNDIAELYWKFIGNDFEVDIDKITGTIHIPNYEADKSTIKAWAHGPLNGNIIINSGEKVSFELEYYDAGNYVEVRLAMPNDIFTGTTLNTNRLDTIISEETYLADEANQARENLQKQKEKQEQTEKNIKIVIKIIGAILTLIFLTKINKYDKEIKENPEIKPENESKYYREIPNEEATPAEAAFLYYFDGKGIQNNLPKVLSSTMLDLSLKKYIEFEAVDKNNKKEQIRVVVKRKDSSELKDDEREIYELLKRIQGENYCFNMKELEKYAKKHYEVFLGKLEKIPDLVMQQREKKEIYSTKNKQKGISWLTKTILYIMTTVFAIVGIIGYSKSVAIGLVLILTSTICAGASAIMASRFNRTNTKRSK